MKWRFGKRTLAMLLTFCMMLSLCVTGASAAKSSRFTDLKTDHWAYDEIMDVVDKGIFQGTGTKTFGPEVEMTRAMFVTVLARLSGAEVDDRAKSEFRDVDTGTWYTGAVAWAADEGIVKGITATRFDPDAVITREQMATMLLRYTDYLKIDLPKTEKAIRFDDDRDISAFAEEAVEACQRAGLLNGVGHDLFDPQGTATRSQVAALISRLAELDGTVAYTVTFVTNVSKKSVDPQTVMSGGKVKQPSLTRSGYTLSGWYTDEDLKDRYSFSDKVYSDLTLYAKWRRQSSGSSTSYYEPVIPEPAAVDDALKGTAYDGVSLTYPALDMHGNELVLSGAYLAENSFTGFDGAVYQNGYVVPVKLTAPSDYNKGEKVHLKITGGTGSYDKDITKGIPADSDWFYLLMFIPDSPGKAWDPQITVTWDDNSILYTLDITGMKKALAPDRSPLVELNTGNVGSQGKNVALPQVLVTKTADKENEYDVQLSGGYVAGLNSGYPNGYFVPIRFKTPGGAGFTGSVTVEAKGAAGNEKKTYENQDNVSSIDYLFYIPATLPNEWAPVLTVTWTQSAAGWFGLMDDAKTQAFTYHMDTSGMRPVSTVKTPAIATDAQMKASTGKDGGDNAAFKGIETYTADAALTAFTASNGVKTATISGTYSYLPAGQNIPGFGTVGTDINSDSVIIPIAFDIPAYLNLDALAGTDVMLSYKMYRADKVAGEIAAVNKSVSQIKAEDPFIYWLRLDQTDGKFSDELLRHGVRFDLTWAGGYQESYLFKLGELKTTAVTGKAPAIPTLTQVSELTKGQDDPFKGIVSYVTLPTLTATTVGGNTVYKISGSYEPFPAGQAIPGFGTVGTDVASDAVILPIYFALPDNLRLDWIGDGDTALTLNVWRSTDGGMTQLPANEGVTQTKAEVKDGFLYLLQLNDPKNAAAKSLKFELKWYGGSTQTIFFSFENFTSKSSNEAGKKYNTTAEERTALANSNGLAAVDPIDIWAGAAAENTTTLKLTRLGAPQTAESLQGFQDGRTSGYVVALKFPRPDIANIATVQETVTGGYGSADAQVKDAVNANGGYTMLLYIPTLAPRWDYAPVVTLDWKDGEGNTLLTQTFKLDLSGMDIAFPR